MSKVKAKTHSGGSKRFKLKSSGKIKRKQAFLRHGMRKRTTKAKRNLRQKTLVAESDLQPIMKLLPNG